MMPNGCAWCASPDQRQHAGGDRLFLVRRHHQTDRWIVQQALQGAACVVGAQWRILWAQLAIQSQQAVEIVLAAPGDE